MGGCWRSHGDPGWMSQGAHDGELSEPVAPRSGGVIVTSPILASSAMIGIVWGASTCRKLSNSDTVRDRIAFSAARLRSGKSQARGS